MNIQDQLHQAVAAALIELGVDGASDRIRFERPAQKTYGDLSTNIALAAAKIAKRPPRDFANELVEKLQHAGVEHLDGVEVAGPGFINFRLNDSWLHASLREIVEAGTENFATPNIGKGEKIQVEFVSANPTGPLHVGNGWLGSYGDALARILARTGSIVEREYYVNDTGNQIRMLGESLLARRKGEPVPEGGYNGEYVIDLANEYDGPEDIGAAGTFAATKILKNISATLSRLGIEYDNWYHASVDEEKKIAETIDELRARGLVFEEEGATWLRSTDYGDVRDRVLVKANGDATYLAGDLSYHRDKFLVRKFDRVIDVFGADHHGQVASLQAGIAALGIDPSRLEVKLGQLVSLVGQKMSKRSGHYVLLDDLIDMIGPDSARLLSLVNSIDQATTLDLDVVDKQSMENPVYYVQYAYARIASIDRVRQQRNVASPILASTDLSVLVHERELDVIRCLSDLPDAIIDAANERAPYKVTNWVRRLAGEFHSFYHDCRILGDEIPADLSAARLVLADGVRIGLSIGLEILGAHAPEEM